MEEHSFTKLDEIFIKEWKIAISNFVIFFLLYLLLQDLLKNNSNIEFKFNNYDILKFLVSCCSILFLHEYTHYFTYYLIGRVSKENLKIGFHKKTLNFFCSCDVPVNVRCMQKVLIFPLIITSILVLCLIYFFPYNWVMLLVCFTVALCTTDILYFFSMLKYRSDYFAVGHESKDFGFCIIKSDEM